MAGGFAQAWLPSQLTNIQRSACAGLDHRIHMSTLVHRVPALVWPHLLVGSHLHGHISSKPADLALCKP